METPDTDTPEGATAASQAGSESPPGHAAAPAVETVAGEPGRPACRPYEFRHSSSLPAQDLRKLRQKYEELLDSLAARLSSLFRLDFALKMSNMEVCSFQKFAAALPDSTHLMLFELEGLPGIGYLEIPLRLALALVDRRAGGNGNAPESIRTLSQIEIGLLERPTHLFLEEYCTLWRPAFNLQPVVLEYESNPRFLDASAAPGGFMLLTIDMGYADLAEKIQLAIPLSVLKPLLASLESPRARSEKKSRMAAPAPSLKWNALYNNVSVEVVAALPTVEMSTRELVNLKIGDVVPIRQRKAQICIENEPRFLAELGNSDGYWAVKVDTGASAGTAPANNATPASSAPTPLPGAPQALAS